MLAVFLVRVNPASTSAKPGCIKNTSIAASSIHTVLTPETNCEIVSVADASSAGASMAVTTSVVITVILSVTAESCAYVSVVKQTAANIARAIHSLVKLHIIYLSIISLIFVVLVFLFVIGYAARLTFCGLSAACYLSCSAL